MKISYLPNIYSVFSLIFTYMFEAGINTHLEKRGKLSGGGQVAGTGPLSWEGPGQTPALGLSGSEAPFTLTANMPGAEWPMSTRDSPIQKLVGAISMRRGLQPLPTHTAALT